MLIGCYDVETTGVDVAKDRIVEIGLVVWDTNRKAFVIRYEKRINPEMPINPKAVEVHGITNGDVMGCDVFKTVAPPLVALLGRLDLIVGHNIARFDLPLLAHELVRAGVTPPPMPPAIDTMLDGRFATDDGKIPTLGELCWSLDVPYDPDKAHGALYDVEVNLQAFLRAVELGVWALPEERRAAA